MEKVDKRYCASSYLMYRMVAEDGVSFCKRYPSKLADVSFERSLVSNGAELLEALQRETNEAARGGKAALALSGGIDSAVLAYLMPKGSTAYTFRCVVPGVKVIDETQQAAVWAQICGLKHRVIDISWDDVAKVTPLLMKHKGAPIHSIEAQIYLAACQAKKDGFETMIFGENADIIFGGMDGLLKKDWTYGEFIERYSYVMPYKVLRDFQMVLEPFKKFEHDGFIDAHAFINTYFRREALGTYNNACQCAGIEFAGPYSKTCLRGPIDLRRIRNGESKYVVREAFDRVFPDYKQPAKIPMPRPTNEWMKDWTGPKRKEFIPNCHINMSGDQKWMIYALERFLQMVDDESGDMP